MGKKTVLLLIAGITLLSGCQSHPQTTSSSESFQGFYRYFADAAVFQDCASGKTFPVSNNIDVQRSYLKQRKLPGEPLFLKFDGHFVTEPSMEMGQMQRAVVIEKGFVFIPDQSCPKHN